MLNKPPLHSGSQLPCLKCGAELDQHFPKCVLWKSFHEMLCKKLVPKPKCLRNVAWVTGTLWKALGTVTENLTYLTQYLPVISGNSPFSPISNISLQVCLHSIQTGLSLNSLYFLILTTLCPFPPPKGLFPTSQNPVRKTVSNADFPMNCSLIPPIRDTVSFLHGLFKKYLIRGCHGMTSVTHNTLTL